MEKKITPIVVAIILHALSGVDKGPVLGNGENDFLRLG
jgi:hypothetical protein